MCQRFQKSATSVAAHGAWKFSPTAEPLMRPSAMAMSVQPENVR